jgi:hypothetical protein
MPTTTKKFILPLTIFLLVLSVVFEHNVMAGTTPPITSAQIDPEYPNGKNGWYTKPVKITLTGTDLESGVKEINYKIDDGSWVKKSFSNSVNLAPNPSFEDIGGLDSLNTKDWVISNSAPGATYTRDTIIYKDEFPVTSIRIDSTDDSWHSINHYDIFAAASSFNNMSAYAWIRTSSASGNAYFNMYSISRDSLGQITTNLIKTSPVVSDTTDWTKISMDFTPTAENVIGVYMEVGIEGTGTMWVDAVNISKSDVPTVLFYVSTDGYHLVKYYSVDKAGNIEPLKLIPLKIDQIPPGRWKDSGSVRSLIGNDHQIYTWIYVEDDTSGISTLTDKFQYFIPKKSTDFGRFPSLFNCKGTWQDGGWAILVSPPFLPGVKKAYLVTPMVDFCDSDWHKACHYVRFYAEDMAGNSAIKDLCINGPWIKIRGNGIVRANQNIEMVAESSEHSTDGLVEVGGDSISFFTSSKNTYLRQTDPPTDFNYQKFSESVKGEKTQISTTGNLVSSSGLYVIEGDYEISNSKIPGGYSSATFDQIVFVNGNLRISSNIGVSDASTALFIVNGDVEIDKKVENVKIGIIAEGDIKTAYNLEESETCKTLNLKGIFIANRVRFSRTLQGNNNEKNPAEYVIYEPKYVLKMSDFIGSNSVKWIYSD